MNYHLAEEYRVTHWEVRITDNIVRYDVQHVYNIYYGQSQVHLGFYTPKLFNIG